MEGRSKQVMEILSRPRTAESAVTATRSEYCHQLLTLPHTDIMYHKCDLGASYLQSLFFIRLTYFNYFRWRSSVKSAS